MIGAHNLVLFVLGARCFMFGSQCLVLFVLGARCFAFGASCLVLFLLCTRCFVFSVWLTRNSHVDNVCASFVSLMFAIRTRLCSPKISVALITLILRDKAMRNLLSRNSSK